MPSERENKSLPTYPQIASYDVDGNLFRAYYDENHNLLFVIDDTVTDEKPNVMLVMPEWDGRKWDEVLTTDFAIDLELVRPRRDNKYQKLDIEYGGLGVYADLMRAYDDGADIDDEIMALMRFRAGAARRAATERLNAALENAEKARDTIQRTDATITDLQAQIRDLRKKLKSQRNSIGREPTKQSASKILRSEAQIDTAGEKLARAKKRLAGARRRLVAAEQDAEIARAILARHPDMEMLPPPAAERPNDIVVRPAPIADDGVVNDMPRFSDVVMFADAPEKPNMDDDNTNTEITFDKSETRTDDMADEKDVKPLFDKDPEILDEEIAFKPIEFDVRAANTAQPRTAAPVDGYRDADVAPSPLSFVPPTQTVNDAEYQPQPAPRNDAPVLDTITSVQTPSGTETFATETFIPQPVVQETPAAAATPQYAPATDYVQPSVAQPQYQSAPQPAPQYAPAAQGAAPATPIPDVVPAPAGAAVRPVSPVKNRSNGTVRPVNSERKKPAIVYYLLLLVLIVLSIFTLWQYQKSMRGTTPDLAAAAAQRIAENQALADAEEPVESTLPDVVEIDEPAEPVVEQVEIIEPEPEPVPVVIVPEPEPAPIPVEPEEDLSSPFLSAAVVEPAKPIVPTEEEILARKPAYNVSQNENMFVADTNYQTDRIADNTAATEQFVVSDVTTDEPVSYTYDDLNANSGYSYDYSADYSTDDASPIVYEETTVTTGSDEEIGCANGAAPDMYGCCPGEDYTDMGDGGFACCAPGTDSCFPPMF